MKEKLLKIEAELRESTKKSFKDMYDKMEDLRQEELRRIK